MVPPDRLPGPRIRERVGTLSQMAAATANRAAVSLKAHFRWVPRFQEVDMNKIARIIDEERAGYEIPYLPRRSARRNAVLPPPRQLALCSATIIVVPRNLLHQWQAEIRKHVADDEDGLRVLIMEKNTDQLPSAKRLMEYDVILFSKSRFESEATDGVDDQGRNSNNIRAGCQCLYIGASRIRDCKCPPLLVGEISGRNCPTIVIFKRQGDNFLVTLIEHSTRSFNNSRLNMTMIDDFGHLFLLRIASSTSLRISTPFGSLVFRA
jgi:hypothetical protein